MRNVLILAANPSNTSPLRLDKEVRDIREGLQRAQHRTNFSLHQRWAVRPRDIQRAMLEVNPQIVHFSGHGLEDEGLVFEDESGLGKPINGKALANLFRLFSNQTECVILNRCYSIIQAEEIVQHINYVIGISQSIGDQAAIEFAVGFYDALGAGRSIEFAYELGCSSMQLSGLSNSLAPVLVINPSFSDNNKSIGLGLDESSPLVNPSVIGKSENDKEAIEVFFSYSHKDEDLRDELATHLTMLQRQGIIKSWHDREISAGKERSNEIDRHMESAQIILLLVSANFLASNYCYDTELKAAMRKHENGKATVVPIILKPVDLEGALFEKLQILPKNSLPITLWNNRDEAFLSIVQELRKLITS